MLLTCSPKQAPVRAPLLPLVTKNSAEPMPKKIEQTTANFKLNLNNIPPPPLLVPRKSMKTDEYHSTETLMANGWGGNKWTGNSAAQFNWHACFNFLSPWKLQEPNRTSIDWSGLANSGSGRRQFSSRTIRFCSCLCYHRA